MPETTTPAPDAVSKAGRPFQARVDEWVTACFGDAIRGDKVERNHRFIEEALELVQAAGCTAHEAHRLVDYVYGRPAGDLAQEVGGVMNTLAALCNIQEIDMVSAGDIELARCWTKIEKIRAKQAAKPKHSLLPEHVQAPSASTPAAPAEDRIDGQLAQTRGDDRQEGENERLVDALISWQRASAMSASNPDVFYDRLNKRDAARRTLLDHMAAKDADLAEAVRWKEAFRTDLEIWERRGQKAKAELAALRTTATSSRPVVVPGAVAGLERAARLIADVAHEADRYRFPSEALQAAIDAVEAEVAQGAVQTIASQAMERDAVLEEAAKVADASSADALRQIEQNKTYARREGHALDSEANRICISHDYTACEIARNIRALKSPRPEPQAAGADRGEG